MYYQGIPPVIKELRIPGCEILCSFEKYLDLIEKVIPSDNELICDKRQTPDYARIEYPSYIQKYIFNLMKLSTNNRNSLQSE